MQPKYRSTSLCDPTVQNADKHTNGQTDRKVKTERPQIFPNDIFYFKTMVIGGLIR